MGSGGAFGGGGGGEGFFEHGHAAGVFGAGADADADPLGEVVAGHGAGDDAAFLHFIADALAVADFDENEIGVGGNEFEVELAEFADEILDALGVVVAGAADVFVIV